MERAPSHLLGCALACGRGGRDDSKVARCAAGSGPRDGSVACAEGQVLGGEDRARGAGRGRGQQPFNAPLSEANEPRGTSWERRAEWGGGSQKPGAVSRAGSGPGCRPRWPQEVSGGAWAAKQRLPEWAWLKRLHTCRSLPLSLSLLSGTRWFSAPAQPYLHVPPLSPDRGERLGV